LAGLLGSTSAAAASPLPVIPDIGLGYAVTFEGPLGHGQLAGSSPDPTSATAALAPYHVTTYQREWQDNTGDNDVQDVVIRFSSTKASRKFLTAVNTSLRSAEILTSRPLPTGGLRTTYFALTTEAGIGETITVRSGDYVAVISFFSGKTAALNPATITLSDAARIAQTQLNALPSPAATSAHHFSWLGWTAIAIGVLGVTDLALISRRRRRKRRRLARGSWSG
jgi:hypothetical protein